MENFNSLVQSVAQAISMGVSRDEIVASLAAKGLSPEDTFLVYQAAVVFAGGVS